MANTYLQRTQATGNRRKHTLSLWVKKSKNETTLNIFTAYNASTDFTELKFNNVDQLQFQNKVGNNWSGELKTNRKFRDVNAWYHIVIVWDSENTNSAAQRMRMYVNGVEESDFATRQNPSNPTDSNIGESGVPIRFGAFNSSEYFNGIMSHVHFSDGYVYDASTFGETDSTTGEWKIKTSPSFTLGTTGYSILKDGNTITDQSTNSNNFSLGGGTLTKTEAYCPSNVFATMNPLFAGDANITYSNGNLKTTATSESQKNAVSTIAVSSGKWYCEMVSRTGTNYPGFGIMDSQSVLQTSISYLGSSSDSYCMFQDGNYYNNGSASNVGTTWGVGSIMGVAIDLDSGTKTIKFYKANSLIHTATISTPANAYVFAVSHNTNGTVAEINFGNGYFGTTAVSSAGTNASGNGIFEYDTPTGYTALSTKGLNT